jgi:hypothetical protein
LFRGTVHRLSRRLCDKENKEGRKKGKQESKAIFISCFPAFLIELDFFDRFLPLVNGYRSGIVSI